MDINGTPVSLEPPRRSLFSCNGTSSASGFVPRCVYTPSCAHPEVTGSVTTMDLYGRYVIECTSTGFLSASPGTIEPSGIATVSLHHSPLPILSTSITTTTVSSAIGTVSPSSTATSPSTNAGAKQSSPVWGVSAVLIVSWIGSFICSNFC